MIRRIGLLGLLSTVLGLLLIPSSAQAQCPDPGFPSCALGFTLPGTYDAATAKRVMTIAVHDNWNVLGSNPTRDRGKVEASLPCAEQDIDAKTGYDLRIVPYNPSIPIDIIVQPSQYLELSPGDTSFAAISPDLADPNATIFGTNSRIFLARMLFENANGTENTNPTPDDICGTVLHEIGHKLGLANRGSCGYADTILAPSNEVGKRGSSAALQSANRLTTHDERVIGEALLNPFSCTDPNPPAAQPVYYTGEGGGGGGGGGEGGGGGGGGGGEGGGGGGGGGGSFFTEAYQTILQWWDQSNSEYICYAYYHVVDIYYATPTTYELIQRDIDMIGEPECINGYPGGFWIWWFVNPW